MDNIAVFQETMQLIRANPELSRRTDEAANCTVLYPEHFRSAKQPHHDACPVTVRRTLTLTAARRLAENHHRIAVLNFANPVEPGGGVLRGSPAQEEYLCRAGNLYPCLTGENALPYYDAHRRMLGGRRSLDGFLSTDLLLYSPGVTFIRHDVFHAFGPVQELTDDWLTADVITCAAPCFYSHGHAAQTPNLDGLLRSRIENILEAAIDNDVDTLVLGAFGCGAFRNPPKVVAKAFYDVLLQPRYASAFAAVCFAIKPSGKYCENVAAFKQAFEPFPPES